MAWVEFWATVLPPLAAALAMVVTALAWTAVAYLKRMALKFAEAQDRQALHSAVSTGVRAELETYPFATNQQVVAGAAQYVLGAGAPEAVKAFRLTGADINRIIVSKVGEERAKCRADGTTDPDHP